MNTKSTLLDVVIALGLLIFSVSGLMSSWQQANLFGLIMSGLSGLFLIWFGLGALRQGLRAPSPMEKFEGRKLLAAGAVGLSGIVLLAVLWKNWLIPATLDAPASIKAVLGVVPFLVWLAATLYVLSRLRDRSETAAAYQRRVGYKDDEPS